MAYEPKYEQKELILECPLKFSVPENGTQCTKFKCVWWMIQQHACAVNVQARSYGYLKNNNQILKGGER